MPGNYSNMAEGRWSEHFTWEWRRQLEPFQTLEPEGNLLSVLILFLSLKFLFSTPFLIRRSVNEHSEETMF